MSSKSGNKTGRSGKKAAKSATKATSPAPEEAPRSPSPSPPPSISSSPSPPPSPSGYIPIPDVKKEDSKDGVGKFVTPLRFELEDVYTYGVSKVKFGGDGYCIPIKLDPKSPETKLLHNIARQNWGSLKLYGDDETTLYLKCDQLTDKQKDELYDEKTMWIKITFDVMGTYRKKNGGAGIGLDIKVRGLGKIRVAEKIKHEAPVDLD